MKRSKFIITALCAILLSTQLKAQEEIILTKIHRPHHADLMIVNNNVGNTDDYIIIFEENAPERFNAPKTPSFAFTSKNQKYIMGIGGYVKGTISMDFNGTINNPAYFTTSAIPINPLPGNNLLTQFNVNQSSLFYNLVSLSDNKTKFGAYINMNFSGAGYTPQIEDAYITYGGSALARRGIEWKSPNAMNPKVMFD